MSKKMLGVAVIGAGMAGRAHAAGYRMATTMYGTDLPDIRLVAIADSYEPFATDAAKRYGFDRAETSWQAIVDAPDIDVVSVVVANALHREVVEALLAAGKHVLCEKPLAPTVDDAKAMVAAAEASDRVAGVGFTYRRSPAINAIRQQLELGAIGGIRHFTGRYWCDYAQDPGAAMSWRYKGGPGSGVLADVGSHLVDLAEYLCGPITSVQGAVMETYTRERPVPRAATMGHSGGDVTGQTEPVENEDIATFTASFSNGALGTFSVSRVAHGHTNGLALDVLGEAGAAGFDLERPGEFSFAHGGQSDNNDGARRVLVGPSHPNVPGGQAMDYTSVGHGQNDFFAWQARAFLDQVAGLNNLPPLPPLSHGLHNMEILAAITESAHSEGRTVQVRQALP